MIRVAERLVRLAARSLPAGVRSRYEEEWLADLDGSDDAGVSRWSVVAGAVSSALTIGRLDPATLGMTLSRAFVLRLRAATGFGLAAALLATGAAAYGVTPGSPGVGAVLAVATVLLAVPAGVATVLAVRTAVAAHRFVAAAFVLAGAVTLLALVVSRTGLIILVVAGVPGIAGLVAAAVTLTRGRLASRRFRLVVSVASSLVALAVAAVGLAHVFVWNPLAKLPGMTLAEIYAGLGAAGEGVILGPSVWVGAVLVLVVTASLALTAFAHLPVRAWRPLRTRRRLASFGLLFVGGAAGLVFVSGFSMGMSIADTFATSGGDAAPAGGILAGVGMLAVAGSIVVSFVAADPAPPQGRPLPA